MSSEEEKRKYQMEMQQALINTGQFPTCLNCEHWGHHTVIGEQDLVDIGTCVKFNMTPPDEVLVIGCVYWLKTIPF